MKEFEEVELKHSVTRELQAKEVAKIQRLCFAVFGTDSGKKLLEHLIDYFIHNRIIADPHADASLAFFSEGQNNLIRQLNFAYKAGKLAAEKETNQKQR